MSGSDLDGDIYWITWNKSLMPNFTVPPASYLPDPPLEDPNITMESITDFFCSYMAQDQLGAIAHAWV
jgi:RNA-dependent RNA polymerase